ncbi:MAG: ABC transporter ATP-binding protein [Actinobacteria bacterium]|nr:ABC transporter ATP-binding protein [Actinomycetota bacterium]
MRLEAVGKRYGFRQPWILRDISRDVAAGTLIRLEGRNGSGKSTLLRMAAGALLPSAGRVTGRPHAGYVPERFPAGLAFSARDYLGHMSRIHGIGGPAGLAVVEEWLERLGASEYAAAPLRTLSKGMCQKVAIAQALLSRPGLLVLDEAWTGLDQAARGELDAAVRERTAAGGIVMYVDHDPARLAADVNERWQLANGSVTVLPGGNHGCPESTAPAERTIVIELTGIEPGSMQRLEQLPGAVSVARDTGAAEPAVLLTVNERDSDAVLREVLRLDGAHVRTVRP